MRLFSALLCFAFVSLNPLIAQEKYTEGKSTKQDFELSESDQQIVEEVVELTDILYSGDYSNGVRKGRGRAILRRLRGNPGVDEKFLFEMEALSSHFDMEFVEENGAVTNWIQIEENLIDLYPDLPFAYEALLNAAEQASDRAISDGVAQDLLAYPKAPDWVKDRARVLLARNDVVGLSLQYVFDDEWPSMSSKTVGKRVLMYTWDAENPEVLKVLAKWLKQQRKEYMILGVCVTPRSEAVEEMKRKLPGEHLVYESLEGPNLITRLHADVGSLVYLSDDTGLVKSVAVKSFSGRQK